MVKNLPCNTRDTGLIPDQRTKNPYAIKPMYNERSHVLQLRTNIVK